jgi:hypothetical protein
MNIAHRNILLYIAKAVTGTVLLFSISNFLYLFDATWVLISTLLVLSPDSSEVIPLTVVRVKANLAASITSVLTLLVFTNVTLAICIAIALTIILCHLLDLMAGSRAALAAIIIVSQHTPGAHLWSTATERVLSVICGCLLGLALTYVFHRALPFDGYLSKDHGSE